MDSVTLYPAILKGKVDIGEDIDEDTVHVITMPRNEAKSLCGIVTDGITSKWVETRSANIRCEVCAERLDSIDKAVCFVYNKKFMSLKS